MLELVGPPEEEKLPPIVRLPPPNPMRKSGADDEEVGPACAEDAEAEREGVA
jgi:hypothetical protein